MNDSLGVHGMKSLHRPPAGSPPARLSVAVSFTRYPMTKHPPCGKPQTVHPGARLPSGGSLRARFAPLQRYYARTKTAARASPPLRFLRRRLIPCAPVGLCLRSARTPRGGDARPQGLALGHPARPIRVRLRKRVRLSQVAGEPSRALAVLSDPAGRTRPCQSGRARPSPPYRKRRLAGSRNLSRLNHTASAPAAYASRFGYPVRARLASGCVARSAGRGSATTPAPAGFLPRISVTGSLPVTSLHAGLSLARRYRPRPRWWGHPAARLISGSPVPWNRCRCRCQRGARRAER
jgi:hypothetical protein